MPQMLLWIYLFNLFGLEIVFICPGKYGKRSTTNASIFVKSDNTLIDYKGKKSMRASVKKNEWKEDELKGLWSWFATRFDKLLNNDGLAIWMGIVFGVAAV